MKQPGTIVRHDDREYLLVEGGFNSETRAVILMARPDDPRFPRDEAVAPIRWAHQGHWTPVARWTQSELRVPRTEHEGQREVIREMVDAYVEKHAAPSTTAWTLRKGKHFASSLEASLPMGLATVCHDTREGAAATPGIEEVVPIDNVGMFLTHLVRLGYGGVLWNASQPVFFCVDEQGDLQFLRVSRTEHDEVSMEILDEKDRWEPYDGAEQIEFIDNREACDERMVEVLGSQPLIGWPDDGLLWSVGPSEGHPTVIRQGESQDEVRHAVLFTSEAAAEAFLSESGPEDSRVFAVRDLDGFLTCEEMQGNVAQLNPGAHRAASGIVWSDGERVVLDSFSGFWRVGADGFEALE
jgi:hypothetical protein